jgi:hypothetical protein
MSRRKNDRLLYKPDKMKTLIAILLVLISYTLYGQENFDGHNWQAPYTLAIPTDWSIERFLIPISFAPEIPYKGVEDIRFTPGWGNVKSEEYWSYAFLWYLDGAVTMNPKTIEDNLKHYYTGLVKVNGAEIPKEKLIPVVTSFKEVKKEKDDLKTFQGTITMTDYMEQKPITLNARVHVRSCPGENKTFVFYKLSPQAPSHKVWLSMDQLWLSFNCKKVRP